VRNNEGFLSVRTMVLVLAAGLSVGCGPATDVEARAADEGQAPRVLSRTQAGLMCVDKDGNETECPAGVMSICVDQNGKVIECPPPRMPPCVDENGNETECPTGAMATCVDANGNPRECPPPGGRVPDPA
jgi:hypothetical protein